MKFKTSRQDLVHGDFHNENLLFLADGSLAGILDFEESFIGNGAIDLIHFIHLACCHSGLSPENLAKSNYFIHSYRDYAKIKNLEIEPALNQFYWKMASSLFFERRLLEEGERFVVYIERDLKKIEFYSNHAQDLLKALIR